MASTTSFPPETVPQAPEDPLFGLARAYKADTSPIKVDLVCCKLLLLLIPSSFPFYPSVPSHCPIHCFPPHSPHHAPRCPAAAFRLDSCVAITAATSEATKAHKSTQSLTNSFRLKITD
jgi:hypothetical protein